VRVPSRPETARGMGLDAITWAREGLIDLLVVTPRWATLEFGLPIPQWRQLLGQTKVTLVGGLEILYRPMPGGTAEAVSPELAHGAASLVLADGADAVYLFNFFPSALPQPVYQSTLRAMTSLALLRKLPRTFAVTYRDITAPDESYTPPLPAKGHEAVFPMKLDLPAAAGWRREAVIGFAPGTGTPRSKPAVFLDGQPCDFREQSPGKSGLSLMSFQLPARALKEGLSHEIKVVSQDETPFVIQQVEVRVRPGK